MCKVLEIHLREKTMIIKTQGQEEERLVPGVWWDRTLETEGADQQVCQGFGFQFQGKESLCKVLEQERWHDVIYIVESILHETGLGPYLINLSYGVPASC